MRRRGLTLVEATMSVLIVAGLLVASTTVFGNVARSQWVQAESRMGNVLAHQLMNEVLQAAFKQSGTLFGPQTGQTRATFPAVDCYDGYAASPPVGKAGTVLAGYTGWSQKVTVQYIDPASMAVSATATKLKRITVTVTAPSGKPYALVGLRSAFGPLEVVPRTQATYVTGVAITLSGAAPAKTVYGGAHPLNVEVP